MFEDASNIQLPHWLSCFEKKREIYRSDKYFVGSWNMFLSLFQSEMAIKDCVWNTALLLAKPDAIESGKGHIIRKFLENAGYDIIAIKRLLIDKKQTSALWQYALGRYSDERFHLLVDLMTSGPSVLFVVKKAAGQLVPLSIQLTNLKGSAEPSQRERNCLRATLGGTQSAILNYIHTSDEPCDIVRELGILFSTRELNKLINNLKRNLYSESPDIKRLLEMQSDQKFDDIDCTNRLEISINRIPDERSRNEALRNLKSCFRGEGKSCEQLSHTLKALQLDINIIDMIILRSKYIALKRDKKNQHFPSCELSHWLDYSTILE